MLQSDSNKFNITIFCLLLTAAAVPIFMVKIPALGDYMNHLARVHIIASVGQNSYLSRFYEIKWALVADIGMDLVVPFLSRFFGIYLSGKIFVFLIILLITTGIYAIHYSIYRKFSLAPVLAFLFLYNHALLIGLLNYLFGMGIAFWAIAFWIGLREHHLALRLFVSLVFVIALFLCHLYGVGLYGLTIFCYESWRLKNNKEKNARKIVADAVVLAVPFIIVILLLLNSPTGGLSHELSWKPFRIKFQAIEWIIGLYHMHIDRMIGALVAGAIIWSLGRGIFRIHPAGWITLILGTFLYIVMPDTIFGAWDADVRLPIAIVFITISFSYWKFSNTSYRAFFIAAVVVMVVIRFVGVGTMWIKYDRVYADFRKSFTYIEPGSSLLTVWARYPTWPYLTGLPINYTNCLAIIDRSVFSPGLFSNEGHQILSDKSKYIEIGHTKPFYFYVNELVEADQNSEKQLSRGGQYWARWKGKFDYLLVLYTSKDDANPLPNSLEPKYQGEGFQLYSINPSK